MKRVERDLYVVPEGTRIAFVDDGSGSYWVVPAVRLQRVPRFLDVRWIAPAFVASTVVVLLTLLAWPVAAIWRLWRKKRWSQDSGDRRRYLAVRLVLLVDAAAIVATSVLFSLLDLTTNNTLDPLVLVVYILAWLGAFGAILTVWSATVFWQKGVGRRWSRIHHSLIAASSVMIAWFFLTFRIAGITLIY